MSVCTKCGGQIPEGMAFCGICGNPVAQTPVYVPAAPVVPPVSGGIKAKGFIGMGLSIYGLEMGIVGLFLSLYFTFIGLFFSLLAGWEIGSAMSFVMSLYAILFATAFSSYSLPMGIVGKILCGSSRKSGNPSKACAVGNGLALAAIIISVVMLVVSFGMFFLSLFGMTVAMPMLSTY